MSSLNVTMNGGRGQVVRGWLTPRLARGLPLLLIAAVVGFVIWRLLGVSADTTEFYARPVASTVRTQAGMVESRLALARRDAEWLGTLLVGRMADSVERTRLLKSSELVALRVRDRTGRTVLDVRSADLPDGGVPPDGATTVSTPTQCLLVVRPSDPTGADREIVAWILPTDRLMGRMLVTPISSASIAQTALLATTADSVHVLSAPGGRYFTAGQSFARASAPRLVAYALSGNPMPSTGPALDGTPVIAAAAPVAGTSIIAIRALSHGEAVRRLRWRLGRDLGIALLLGALGVAVVVFGARERRTHQLETALLRTRLESLQQHLRPHFLFNALTAIGELAHSSPTRAEAVVLQLSDLLRESLALPADAIVPLERELTLLEAYLAVERERFGDALEVTIDVPSALRATGVLPWTLQPLVENALKHGARPCRVAIVATQVGSQLRLEVSNALAAHDAARPGTGIGLSNLRDRMQAVFGRDGSLSTARRDDRFVVAVHLPARPAPLALAA
jgi:hypothetical protein